jgi:hypothetical protein
LVLFPISFSSGNYLRFHLELAARTGAGRLAAVRTVTLPILAPSVYSAAFLAFVTSFDELVVAMFIAGTIAGRRSLVPRTRRAETRNDLNRRYGRHGWLDLAQDAVEHLVWQRHVARQWCFDKRAPA